MQILACISRWHVHWNQVIVFVDLFQAVNRIVLDFQLAFMRLNDDKWPFITMKDLSKVTTIYLVVNILYYTIEWKLIYLAIDYDEFLIKMRAQVFYSKGRLETLIFCNLVFGIQPYLFNTFIMNLILIQYLISGQTFLLLSHTVVYHKSDDFYYRNFPN